MFSAETAELTEPPVSGQGDISGVSFSSDGGLYVADRAIRVTKYALPDFNRQARYSPRLNLVLKTYRYGVVPLYTVFPKPGELDTTFEYFLSGKETADGGGDLSSAKETIDPWTPLWSSALFTIVVLAVACVYIEWQEF